MPAANNIASRSPSPTPAPPVGDAPGARATRLINTFDSAIDSTLKKCSYKSFAECFPTPAQYVPESLEHLWKSFDTQLEATWKNDFKDLLVQRDVVQSLNSLDQYVGDAKKRKERAEGEANGGPVADPTPPHMLPPSSLHLAHLMPFLEEHTTLLNTQLVETQSSNKELLSTVTAQRSEIEALVRGLESVIHDLESSAQMMGQDEVQGLSTEIREIEMELKE